MTSITFDTLDAARSLRDAGMDERTAAAVVAVVKQTTDLPRIDHLATKEALAALDAKVNDLRTLMFAGFGLNIASILGVAGFLYAVLK
jgi:hypothetical protein